MREHPPRVKDIRWRKAIRDKVEALYPQAPFAEPPSGTKFDVEVSFRMTPEDLARPAFDLDNFVKPILDTIYLAERLARSHRRALSGERHVRFPARPSEGRGGDSAGPGCRHNGHSAPTGYPGSQGCFRFPFG